MMGKITVFPVAHFFCILSVWQCWIGKTTINARIKTTGRDTDEQRITTTSSMAGVVSPPLVRPQYGVNGDGGTSPFTPFWGRGHRWRWST
jgi:hypothetical protein